MNQYIVKTLQKLIQNFVKSQTWRIIARKYIAHLTFRIWGYPKFDLGNYPKIKKIITDNPTSVFGFVGADTQSLSWTINHMFTGCQWGHAGMIEMVQDEPMISDMRGEGLDSDHLLNYLKETDHFALLEFKFKDEDAKQKALARWKRIKTAPNVNYDYELSLDPKLISWATNDDQNVQIKTLDVGTLPLNIYCSEYPYLIGVGLVEPDFKTEEQYGVLAFEPDDFYKFSTVRFEA
jgi:hypothetical protein